MTATITTTEYGFSYLTCDCSNTQIRRRTRANGVAAFVMQCIECGREIRAVSQRSPEVLALADITAFDEALRDAWEERRRAHYALQQRIRENEQHQKNAEWWAWYDAYLLTPAWRVKRQKVLERASGICEGCCERRATQVHHKSYEHVGHELLFELVAVCDDCHRILHPDMDNR